MKTLVAFFCATALFGVTISAVHAADTIESTRALKRLSFEEIKKLADGGDAKAEAELAARYGLGAGVP